jgi:hypothetical protein
MDATGQSAIPGHAVYKCDCGRTLEVPIATKQFCITCNTFIYCGISKDAFESKQTKSRGLGDTIRKITTALHIPHCGGCEQRQAKLNEMFPYKR